LPAFESKKYAAYDRFEGNSLYGEIPTKKGPITMLGFALPYNNGHYFVLTERGTCVLTKGLPLDHYETNSTI